MSCPAKCQAGIWGWLVKTCGLDRPVKFYRECHEEVAVINARMIKRAK